MKIVAKLPPRKYYNFWKDKRQNYIFSDRSMKFVTIESPTFDPWGKEWIINLGFKFQKSDRSKYPIDLAIKLFEPDLSTNLPRCQIDRNQFKSRFAYANEPCKAFYCFESQWDGHERHGRTKFWIAYTIYEI